jgi:hypothetical protein
MLEKSNKGRRGGGLYGDFAMRPKNGVPESPVVMNLQLSCRHPEAAPSRNRNHTNELGEPLGMSKTKIRIALLWAAMLASMILSSGVASANWGWG